MKKKITIVGLGCGGSEQLTLGALKELEGEGRVVLRTQKHQAVPFLIERGIEYTALDDIYENSDNFDDAYEKMVQRIIDMAQEDKVILALPGHPLIGERLTFEIIKKVNKDEYDIDIIPGISQGGSLIAMLKDSQMTGLRIMQADELIDSILDTRLTTVILNIWSHLTAVDTKLRLLDVYPFDHIVYICSRDDAGVPHMQTVPIYELDRLDIYDHTTCLYLPKADMYDLKSFDFKHLCDIVELLRSPDGCPWDREQTHESLKQCLIEETYEVLEAIDKKDPDKLTEELGDVLLQVVFHSQISKEHTDFDIGDVISAVCKKMILRHPHIFGNVSVKDSDEVVSNWEAIKKEEKGLKTQTQVLRDIPANLPSLMRSYKVQKKAALVGFDWDKPEDAILKVDEELTEVKDAYSSGDKHKISEEIGDLLFAVVNVARFLKVEPELALTATIEKFINRFEYIEKNADKPLEEMTLMQMDELWNKAKHLF